MVDHLPFDAVAFTPGALLAADLEADAPDPSRPGARRVVGTLAKLDVRMAVVLDPGQSSLGATIDRLDEAGISGIPVIPTTGGPGDAAPAPPPFPMIPARTLVIAASTDPPPDPEIAATFAGVIILHPDDLLNHAVLSVVADYLGPARAAALLVPPLDDMAMAAAGQRHLSLTKPPGALGRLEDLGVLLSGISGQVPPPTPRPAAVAIFAADHGVHAEGVSPWPQEVTTQMVSNFLAGGAAINVLARVAKARVVVVDVGVAADLPRGELNLIDRKVGYGTQDLALGPAMSTEQCVQALDVGAEAAIGLVAAGSRCLLTGDMGIANTTASAALVGALTGRRAGDITGPGSGLPESEVPRKATIVAEAVARARAHYGEDPVGILTEVGGFEHAALAGFILGAAAAGVPVIVDGAIAASALLVAARMVPGVENLVIAGHRSSEPASSAVLDELGLQPVVDLDLRLGEGTGAALALPLVDAAARILSEMATFDQAGVSSKLP